MSLTPVSTVTDKANRRRSAPDVRQKALREYRRGDRVEDIASRYGISVGTVSIWAGNAGIKRRSQGCRLKETPNQRDLEITDRVRKAKESGNGETMFAIAEEFGLTTRAAVWRIYHKWKNWKQRIPFKAGDRIIFNGKEYDVIEPDVFDGKVKNASTGKELVIPWNVNGHRAVKL